jgi:hypothetical protein
MKWGADAGKRNADRRRALKLLAASPDGCTEAIMLAHGFTADMLADMIRAGLATAHAERMVAGGKSIEIARVKSPRRGGGRCEDREPA